MQSPENILYAGYGANRDPRMIEAITGQTPKIIGKVAIRDVELCVQRIEHAPDVVSETAPAPLSPRQILAEAWGEDGSFETYTIRKKEGSQVMATLFELSPKERALIAEWELIEFGWYDRMQVAVDAEDGSVIEAETEGLGEGQNIDRVVDGQRYDAYLVNPVDMYRIAEQTRRDYLERAE